MIYFSLAELAIYVQGTLNVNQNLSFQGISIDSRTIQPGNLFIAIKGERCDGHDFIKQAQQKGAVAVMVMQEIADATFPQVKVADTTLALGKLAAIWRKRWSLPLIAVTGSNGKTTTKNMLAAILTQQYEGNSNAVLATRGNWNNHWGVPLMLAQIGAEHRAAVIEMGMNHFHEIQYLSQLARPTIALITNAGAAHLAGVGGTVAGVAKAKGEIFLGLNAEGTAIINADDDFADYWKTLVPNKKIITFGMQSQAEVQGEIQEKGFILHYQQQNIFIALKLLGKHNVYNALAASAAALANGASLSHIKIGLEKLLPEHGRLEIKSINEKITIVDDTYNANPVSMRAALETIAPWHGEKIIVLGDMGELGDAALAAHQEIGKIAKQLGYQHLLAVGEWMRYAVNAFGEGAQHFDNQAGLIAALQRRIKPAMTILVKGSRAQKMEQVVAALQANYFNQ